ncbi:MAG: class I tRNA ligase family protein, partial [Stenotrophomonas sp.]
GQKMSKSKGNVLDPLDIIDGISLEDLVAKRTGGLMQPKMAEKIEKATRKEFPNGIIAHGADALRFTIAALATHGRDIKFDMSRAEGYKNFCNKLWNASRFALMNTEGASFTGTPTPRTDAERWILSRLDAVATEAAQHFAGYRFDLLAQCLYEFVWNEVCDWFLELSKPALQGDLSSEQAQADAQSTRHTLLHVLEAVQRLLHPLTPFVTEQLWKEIAPRLGITTETLSLRPYPVAGEVAGDFAAAEADVEWLKSMVSALRRVRSELGVSPSKQIGLLLQGGVAADRDRTERFSSQLRFLLKLESITWLAEGEACPPVAPAVVGELKLLVPLEGLVDLDAERVRLDKEIARVAGEKDKSQAKLAKFSDKVPAAVIEQERVRLADWSTQLAGLQEQRAKL